MRKKPKKKVDPSISPSFLARKKVDDEFTIPSAADLSVNVYEDVGVGESVGSGNGAPREENQVATSTRHKVNAIVLQARAAGIPSFLLAFRDPETQNAATFTAENLPLSDAVNLSGAAWQHFLQMELDRHPEYEKEYALIFKEAKVEFQKILSDVNKKVITYRAHKRS